MANIIDGKKQSNKILSDLKDRLDQITKKNISPPKLVIILIGSNAASVVYVRNKMSAAQKTGIHAELKTFSEDVSHQELLSEINKLNKNTEVSGIIIQLPIPVHINKNQILQAIDPSKDVDGFHPINVGMLYAGINEGFIPCTARGCLALIQSCILDLSGMHAVIVGRSNIVGRPLAALLLQHDCTVTICHSRTVNLSSITAKADIVISAVGTPEFMTGEYFNENAIVIDVGINRIIDKNGQNKLVGDVHFSSVKDKVKHITPVPGGVGPMTVAYLLVNSFVAKFSTF